MLKWFTQLRIKMIPTLKKWSDLGIVEIEHPDAFFSIGYQRPEYADDSYVAPEIQGVICPIPNEMMPAKGELTQYYNDIKCHWDCQTIRSQEGDLAHRLSFDMSGPIRPVKRVPPKLLAIDYMLTDAFVRTLDVWPGSSVYQINSNYHRTPRKHNPTGIACLDGATTIIFRTNADGKITGKKSLPPNSMAIFLGYHAAPDSSAPRMNILVG